MAYYRQVGDVPSKRHIQFRDDDGALRAVVLESVANGNGSTGVFTDPERYRISSFTVANFWGIVYDDGGTGGSAGSDLELIEAAKTSGKAQAPLR